MSNWVFLRGLTRESAHWGDFPQRFAAALPGARVHLIDLAGNALADLPVGAAQHLVDLALLASANADDAVADIPEVRLRRLRVRVVMLGQQPRQFHVEHHVGTLGVDGQELLGVNGQHLAAVGELAVAHAPRRLERDHFVNHAPQAADRPYSTRAAIGTR